MKFRVLLCAVALFAVACGGKKEESSPTGASQAGQTAKPAAKAKPAPSQAAPAVATRPGGKAPSALTGTAPSDGKAPVDPATLKPNLPPPAADKVPPPPEPRIADLTPLDTVVLEISMVKIQMGSEAGATVDKPAQLKALLARLDLKRPLTHTAARCKTQLALDMVGSEGQLLGTLALCEGSAFKADHEAIFIRPDEKTRYGFRVMDGAGLEALVKTHLK